MKTKLLFLVLLPLLFSMRPPEKKAVPAVYYVSTSGSDLNSGTTLSAPFKTIAKINSLSLPAGAQILFKRGETFSGSLQLHNSGTSGAPILITAYGTGAKPVLSGFTTVSSWNAIGSGVWESGSSIGSFSELQLCVINGRQYTRGRYPNAGTSNGGYLTIDNHNSNVSLTDAALTTNYSGAKAIIRLNDWTLDSATFTQSGSTITFKNPIRYEPKNGWGYFITNSPDVLDQYGEWYYNGSTHKLRWKTSGTTTPTETVQVPAVTDVVNIYNLDYITLQDLALEGANQNGVHTYSGIGVKVLNCDIRFCGNDGILGGNDNINCTMQYNTISDVGNNGIDFRECGAGAVITDNTFKNIGLLPASGGTSPQCRSAVCTNGSTGHQILRNVCDSIGMAGIRCRGSNTDIAYNYVRHFSLCLQDIGGVYSAQQSGGTTTGMRIFNNVIDGSGSGNSDGTSGTFKRASGVYLDDGSNGIEAFNNTAFNCPKAGVYIHNSHDISIHHNTAYNNGQAQIQVVHDNNRFLHTTGLRFYRNTALSLSATDWLIWFYDRGDSIRYFGLIDTNYYSRPLAETQTIQAKKYVYLSSQVTTNYTFAQWQNSGYGLDLHSYNSAKTFSSADSISFIVNPSGSALSIAVSGSYIDPSGAGYSGTVVVDPYTSKILLANGAGGIITLPTDSLPPVVPPPPAASFNAVHWKPKNE
jgi:parallel beta-helix repeat protein